MAWIDRREEAQVLAEAKELANRRKQTKPQDALVGQRLANIYRRHPYIPTGVALSLAESNADMVTVDAVAMRSSTTKYVKMAEQTQTPTVTDESSRDPEVMAKRKRSWWSVGWDTVGDAVKWGLGNTVGRLDAVKDASKLATAIGETGAQTVQNLGSKFTDPETTLRQKLNFSLREADEFAESTSLGQLMENPELTGSGFFVGGEAEQKRLEAVRKYRWQINGESFTVGRYTANEVFIPGSGPYRVLSGVIDGAITFYADPLNKPVDKLFKGIKAQKAIPALSSLDEVTAARKLAEGQAGLLTSSEQVAIDASKFFNWLDNSKIGQNLVARTAQETNELKILEAYNYRITPQQARILAQTTDPDQIRGIIAEAAIRLSDETERGMIPFVTSADELGPMGFLSSVSEKIPGYNAIRQSRWLAKVPSQAQMVAGTQLQKAEALKNMVNWLRLLDVDPYSGEGEKLMRLAFDWAGADGTKVDANKMIRLFLGDQKAGIRGILPTYLSKLGVSEDEIFDIDAVFRDREQLLRKYSFDATGATNDHGLMVYLTQFQTDKELADMLVELFPTRVNRSMSRAELDAFVQSLQPGELSVFGPTTLSQMLNNVVILPDPRVIRKLSNNPFYLRTPRGKQARTAKAVEIIQNDIWRPWALATYGFVMRNGFDAQTRIAMAGLSTENPIDYLLIALNKRGIGTIAGDTWKSAEEVPAIRIRKVAKSKDPEKIKDFLSEYFPLDFPMSDDILDDLVGASTTEEVVDVLNRVRPLMEELDEYTDFIRSYSKMMVEDPRHQMANLIEDGQFDVVNPSDGTFAKAMLDQAGLIFADPLQRFAARLSHLPVDRQIKVLSRWLDSGTKDAVRARRSIVDAVINPLVGNKYNGKNVVKAQVADATNMTTDELVEAWYATNNAQQVALYTQGTDELRTLVGYNSVPVAPSQIIDEDIAKSLNGGQLPKPGDLLVETTVNSRGENIQITHLVLESHTTAKTKARTFKTIEVVDAFSAMSRKPGASSFSPAAREFVDNLLRLNASDVAAGLDPVVPPQALLRVQTPILRPGGAKGAVIAAGETAENIATFLPRWFFRHAVDPAARNLERSPAFRKRYYNIIRENISLLEPSEAQKILDIIDQVAAAQFPKMYARNPDQAMEAFVGGKSVLEAIKESVTTPGIGATAEQLQDYAMTLTKIDMENLFFSNVERSNFTDAFRVAAPFGAAWAEIAGTYGRALIENPARIRKAQIVYRGLEGYDPDEDDRGFFWTDPNTGKQMFAFPLSSYAIKAFTALTGTPIENTFLAAPTSRLSAGFSIFPSLGPVYSVVASEFFNRSDVSPTNRWRKTLLPYGDAEIRGLIPGTWSKVLEAIDSGSIDLTSMRANTEADIFAYLVSTGRYDLTDPDDVTRAQNDAQESASGMMLVRAATQFFGPTAGSPQFRYEKEAGEFYYVNEMTKAFSDMQNENYDTAVKTFIETFGENALIYLSGKSKIDPAYQGVEATVKYGEWEQENSELIAAFPKTAPFLAPGGFGEFSMEVYSKQLSAGVRKKRDNRDRLADAQRRIGSALYKHIRNQFPDALTQGQRLQLKEYRERIHNQYPGFPKTVEFKVGEFDNFIDNLGKLVQNPATEGNKVRDSIYDYLKYRANVNATLKKRAGVSLNAAKNPTAIAARGLLYARGEALADQNPDFRRIWDQELAAEVEAVDEDED